MANNGPDSNKQLAARKHRKKSILVRSQLTEKVAALENEQALLKSTIAQQSEENLQLIARRDLLRYVLSTGLMQASNELQMQAIYASPMQPVYVPMQAVYAPMQAVYYVPMPEAQEASMQAANTISKEAALPSRFSNL